MTMLAHTGGSFQPSSCPSDDTHAAQGVDDRLTTIKQFCLLGLTVLLAGGLLVGIVALRTAVYVSRLAF